MVRRLLMMLIATAVLLAGGSGLGHVVGKLPKTLAGTVTLSSDAQQVLRKAPHAYIVLLDVSGSTMWNFQGQAVRGTRPLQCAPGSSPALQSQYKQDREACPEQGWLPVEERRIAVAEQALLRFIDRLAPDDWVQIVAFSGAVPVAASAPGSLGTEEGKASLRKTIEQAVTLWGERYRAASGTPTATALALAQQLLDGPETPRYTPGGLPYLPVVVLLTDGVPNYYLTPDNGRYIINDAAVGWFNQAQDQGGQCMLDGSERVECHQGYAETSDGVVARPLTAAIEQGQLIRQQAALAVIGYASAPHELAQLAPAEAAPWYQHVDAPADLAPALERAGGLAISDICSLAERPPWVGTPAPAASGTPPPSSAQATGQITLSGPDGRQWQAPIIADPQSGALSYSIDNLPPDRYTMRAWVSQRTADGTVQRYVLSGEILGQPDDAWLPVEVPSAFVSGAVVQDFTLVVEQAACDA